MPWLAVRVAAMAEQWASGKEGCGAVEEEGDAMLAL